MPLSVNRQGQFPAVTVSFNLGPNAALGDAIDEITKVQQQIALPGEPSGRLPGNGCFVSQLASE